MSSYRLALLTAALALAQGSASAATLGGSATPGSTTLGGMATVDLALTLSDPVVLMAVSLSLDWDPGLDFDSASAQIFGQNLTSFIGLFDPAFTTYVSTPGHLGVVLQADVVPPSLPAGAASMSFTFAGLAEGTHNVHVEIGLTNDSFEDSSLMLDSTVTVTPVPEVPPATMLAAGLAVVGLLVRRRRPS